MTRPSPEPLVLTVTRPEPGHAHLQVNGEVDYDTAGDLLETVTTVLDEPGPSRATRITMDCAGVRLCDSMGLSALIMAKRNADDAGVPLRLTSVPPAMARLLAITGTDAYLTGLTAQETVPGQARVSSEQEPG